MSAERVSRLLRVQEFADRLGISVWSARRWCYEGKCDSCKLGGKLLMVPESEVDRLIAESLRPRILDAA